MSCGESPHNDTLDTDRARGSGLALQQIGCETKGMGDLLGRRVSKDYPFHTKKNLSGIRYFSSRYKAFAGLINNIGDSSQNDRLMHINQREKQAQKP
jgi:hypothetical protein